jgi:hypothetical protein
LQGLVQWSLTPASLATWEDLEALKQRFHAALVWGQPGAYRGEGDVRTSTGNDQAVEENEDVGPVGRRRSSRVKKINTVVVGPEWIDL